MNLTPAGSDANFQLGQMPLPQVHLVERMPFFDALYFVTTTLTTVGFGDVVVSSTLGRAAVLAMICVGVVLIPVQTSQLYTQLSARRLTLGLLPSPSWLEQASSTSAHLKHLDPVSLAMQKRVQLHWLSSL